MKPLFQLDVDLPRIGVPPKVVLLSSRNRRLVKLSGAVVKISAPRLKKPSRVDALAGATHITPKSSPDQLCWRRNSYRSIVAAKRDCSSVRTTLPTQRKRTSVRVPGALGSVIKYSIAAPTATGVLDMNRTPQELTFLVSPLALVLAAPTIISSGRRKSKR